MKELQIQTISFGKNGPEKTEKNQKFLEDRGTENLVVNLYPEVRFETWDSFGGALTDSASYVYAQMSEEQKHEVVHAYFSDEGMGYRNVRIPMDGCDFTAETYAAVEDPEDFELKTFSFARTEQYIIPFLRDAERAAGRKLNILLSPWSPPAFAKTNQIRQYGGKLLPEYRTFWAECLCRYIKEFRDRGFHVKAMTMQNEPKAVQFWDSCIFTAEEERAFLVEEMIPALRRNGLDDIEIYLWDHNKERLYDWMSTIIDEETDPMIAGGAFHWYSGDHFDAISMCRKAFPNKKLIMSESCVEFSKYGREKVLPSAIRMAHELIEDIEHGMTAAYDWNVMLNEYGGPSYVGNYCLAPYLYDEKNGVLERQLLADYYELLAQHIKPGSVRVATTRFTDKIHATANIGPDGTTNLVLLNPLKKKVKFSLRAYGKEADIVLPRESLTGVKI